MYKLVRITTLFFVASILSKDLVVFGQGSDFSLTNSDNGILETRVDLSCQYKYQSTEITRSATFSRKRPTELLFTDIVTVTIQDNPVNDFIDTDLGTRSNVYSNRTHVRLEINTIKCNDQAEYMCTFFGSNRSTDFIAKSNGSPLEVKARPKMPQVSFTPTEVIENEAVKLFCHGNVGRPAGSFALSLVRNGMETPLNAELGLVEVETNGCTFEQSATAYHNFTAADKGRTSFRCRTTQDFADPNVHVNETETFNVQYTPRETKMFNSVDNAGKIQVNPGSVVKVPVGSNVVLICETNSNPSALYVWSYVLDGSTDTVTDSPTSTGVFNMQPVRLDQTGIYTCTFSNTIRNDTFTDQVFMTLNVSNIPTSPPPVVTTDGSGTAGTDSVTKEPGATKPEPNQAGLIGGIVGGVIAVIIIVIIVVIVLRRRNNNKQPLDNLSNKPKNNQDPKTVVVHPHIVSPQARDNYDNFNKAFEKNEKDLYYADLKFDDTPRSRKPVQILAEQTNYAEVAWPRV